MAWVQGPVFATASAGSVAKTFAGSTPVGNLVVVDTTQNNGANPTRGMPTITDSAGNKYLQCIASQDATPNSRIDKFCSVVTVSGTLTVTASFTGGNADCDIAINEYDSSAIYLWAVSANSGTGASATPGSAGASVPGSALFSVGLCHDNSGTMTPDAAWAQRQEDESLSNATINVHDKITTGAQNPATAMGATIGTWNCVMAVFGSTPKPAGGSFDDRYRFRGSVFSSGTSTLGTKRSAWPDDAMDGGMRDTIADYGTRIN